MNAFVVVPKINHLMQICDVFNIHKVIYSIVELKYVVNNVEIINEDDISKLAKLEFKESLIFLKGKEDPLCINSNIQVISTGTGWTTLLDALTQLYPDREFTTNDRMMDIKIKPIEMKIL